MYQFRRILKMDLTNLFTNPMWLIGSIGLPFLLTLIMGFITRGGYGNIVTSYDYYGITMMIFGGLNTATLAANSFMETRILKANMRLCNAPISSFQIYFPKVLASFIFGLFCHTIVGFALYFIVGVNFGGINTMFLWLLLLAVNFFAASLGVMLCCILKSEETVNQLLSNFVSIFCLLGGAFFPLKGLGRMINVVSNISPATWISIAAFQAIYDHKFVIFLPVILILFLLSFLWIGLSSKFFNMEDYL